MRLAHFTCSLILVLYGCASTGRPAPQYGIKEDVPRTGSNIRHDAVYRGSVPINRKYSELTSEEKKIVHSWYQEIAPGDEPPFPINGLFPIHDALRQAQQKLLVSGKLVLIATVEPSGDVSSVKAIGAPSPEIVKFAGKVLLLTKFKPAYCRNKPCKMDFPLKYDFQVR